MNLLYTDKEMNKIRIIQKFIDGKINIYDTADALSCSLRTVYRYKKILINEWPPWFIHWLKWKAPNHNPFYSKYADIDKIVTKPKFAGFWPTLLSEKLFEIYWFRINKESLRRRMIKLWLWLPQNLKKLSLIEKREKEKNLTDCLYN